MIVVLMSILIVRHGEAARADRVRERLQHEFGPVFSRFLESEDPVHLAEALRPAFMRMNAAERPVAAVLITDVMRKASTSQKEQLRRALEAAGLVDLGERGTRRARGARRRGGPPGAPARRPARLGFRCSRANSGSGRPHGIRPRRGLLDGGPRHAGDLARLAAWGLVESLWFRPAMAWWRLKGNGARPDWTPTRLGCDPARRGHSRAPGAGAGRRHPHAVRLLRLRGRPFAA